MNEPVTEALELLPVEAPPTGFADRVLDRHAQAPAKPRRARFKPPVPYRWIAVAMAAVILLLWLPLRRPSSTAPSSGSIATDSRQTLKVSGRATLVAEADSRLTWDASGKGPVVVGQSAGNVFYRVEPGDSFVVRTPAGEVRVLGTSFRVEVIPMQKKWMFAAGAAAGVVAVVTVYEGRVLLANSVGEVRLEAGESAQASAEGAPQKRAAELSTQQSAPDSGVTRQELLQRDEVQRQEIASLRAKLKGLEKGESAPHEMGHAATDPDGQPWFSPSQETLKAFAGECRIRFDTPEVFGSEPYRMSAEAASELGLNLTEWDAVNAAMQDLQKRTQAKMRTIYLEVASDAKSADILSARAMQSEIHDRSDRSENGIILKKLSAERAGLATPPSDLSQLTPLERLLRLQTGLGDETEKMLGQVLGKQRAREMRTKNGGYGNRSEMSGCPDEPSP